MESRFLGPEYARCYVFLACINDILILGQKGDLSSKKGTNQSEEILETGTYSHARGKESKHSE